MPNNSTKRFLYLIKEPCGVFIKILLWIICIQMGGMVYLITGHRFAIVVGCIIGIPVWILANRSVGYFKIGITSNLKRRLTEINNGNARVVYYVAQKKLDGAGTIEKRIHQRLDKKRRDGEWFRLWFWQVWWLKWRYFR